MKIRHRPHTGDTRTPLMPVVTGNLANVATKKSPRKKISPKGKRKLDFKHKSEGGVLKGKRFYLDIQGSNRNKQLQEQIIEHDGIVEEFLSKELDFVLTDKKADDYKQLIARSTPSPFSGPSPLQQLSSNKCNNQVGNSPYSTDSPQNVEVKRLENSQTTRGTKFLKRAAVTQKLGTSDILTNARTWGVKVVKADSFLDWILRKKSQKPADSKKSIVLSTNRKLSAGGLTVRRLNTPFLKVEDLSRKYKPLVLELKTWPTLSFDVSNQCPFDHVRAKVVQKDANQYEKLADKETDKQSGLSEKASPGSKKEKADSNKLAGYCECCCVRYNDIKAHLIGDQHKNFAKDVKNYESLDEIISKGNSIEEFLESVKKKYDTSPTRADTRDEEVQIVNEEEKKRETVVAVGATNPPLRSSPRLNKRNNENVINEDKPDETVDKEGTESNYAIGSDFKHTKRSSKLNLREKGCDQPLDECLDQGNGLVFDLPQDSRTSSTPIPHSVVELENFKGPNDYARTDEGVLSVAVCNRSSSSNKSMSEEIPFPTNLNEKRSTSFHSPIKEPRADHIVEVKEGNIAESRNCASPFLLSDEKTTSDNSVPVPINDSSKTKKRNKRKSSKLSDDHKSTSLKTSKRHNHSPPIYTRRVTRGHGHSPHSENEEVSGSGPSPFEDRTTLENVNQTSHSLVESRKARKEIDLAKCEGERASRESRQKSSSIVNLESATHSKITLNEPYNNSTEGLSSVRRNGKKKERSLASRFSPELDVSGQHVCSENKETRSAARSRCMDKKRKTKKMTMSTPDVDPGLVAHNTLEIARCNDKESLSDKKTSISSQMEVVIESTENVGLDHGSAIQDILLRYVNGPEIKTSDECYPFSATGTKNLPYMQDFAEQRHPMETDNALCINNYELEKGYNACQPLGYRIQDGISLDNVHGFKSSVMELDSAVFTSHSTPLRKLRSSPKRKSSHTSLPLAKEERHLEACQFSSEADDAGKTDFINLDNILTGLSGSPLKDGIYADIDLLRLQHIKDSKQSIVPMEERSHLDTYEIDNPENQSQTKESSRKRLANEDCSVGGRDRKKSKTSNSFRFDDAASDCSLLTQGSRQSDDIFSVGLTERIKMRKRRASSVALDLMSQGKTPPKIAKSSSKRTSKEAKSARKQIRYSEVDAQSRHKTDDETCNFRELRTSTPPKKPGTNRRRSPRIQHCSEFPENSPKYQCRNLSSALNTSSIFLNSSLENLSWMKSPDHSLRLNRSKERALELISNVSNIFQNNRSFTEVKLQSNSNVTQRGRNEVCGQTLPAAIAVPNSDCVMFSPLKPLPKIPLIDLSKPVDRVPPLPPLKYHNSTTPKDEDDDVFTEAKPYRPICRSQKKSQRQCHNRASIADPSSAFLSNAKIRSKSAPHTEKSVSNAKKTKSKSRRLENSFEFVE